jgi:hypothetical protein
MRLCKFEYTKSWPITFSNEFFNYLNTSVKGMQIFIEHENIVMPIIFKKKLFLKIGYCIYPPLKDGKKLLVNEEKSFFEALSVYLKHNKIVDFILPPIHTENFQHLPQKSEGFKLGIIRLPLKNRTENEIFASFDSMYRSRIRKALKEEVVIKFGIEYFDDFYKLYQEKLVLENAPYDTYEQIKLITANLIKIGCATCAVAYINDKPDAGTVNLNDTNNAYNMWAGTSTKSHPGSLRLLHWEIIRLYLKMGVENYRMGGARQGSHLNEKHARLLDFKTGFGCVVDEGYHFTFIVNDLKYKIYKSLMAIKSKIKK